MLELPESYVEEVLDYRMLVELLWLKLDLAEVYVKMDDFDTSWKLKEEVKSLLSQLNEFASECIAKKSDLISMWLVSRDKTQGNED